jgi:hypothetical protein
LGDSLVVVYCNVEDNSTELWFLEDMDDNGTAPRWSRRYTLQCTPFAEDKPWRHKYFRISASVRQYHCPVAVLVRTTGIRFFAERRRLCRVFFFRALGKASALGKEDFAECQIKNTQQRSFFAECKKNTR